MSDELRRIETLERLVRHLTLEVAELRSALRAEPRGAMRDEPGSARPEAPAPRHGLAVSHAADVSVPRPADPLADQPRVDWSGASHDVPARRRPTPPDVERLVGRYGTVALAVLTIVMGVGAFLRWAIDHIEIGPWPRVVAGAVAAAATGALGWRLRSRGARQYGNMLIGLALALVHVVAWGAGPYLRLVPDGAALSVAALASIVLAAIAWKEGEQPLFAAGLGGAFLAPFVTTRGGGSPESLLAYATPLVLTATLAIGRGDWRVARRILAMGTLLFAAAALAALPDGTSEWWRKAYGPGFALGAALFAQLAASERNRRPLVYAHLASALMVLVAFASPSPPMFAAAALGVAGAVLAAVASRGEGDAMGSAWELRLSSTGTYFIGEPAAAPIPWVGATGFPVAFLAVALLSLDDPVGRDAGAVATAFAVVALAMAARDWRGDAARRGAHLVAAGLALVASLALGLQDQELPRALALAALGVVLGAVAARSATPLALMPALLATALATALAAVMLERRPAWEYAPFATTASLAALAAVLSWWLVGRETARLTGGEPRPHQVEESIVLRGIAYAAAFGWGHEELRHAGSRELATFLLIAYYAASGVLVIGLGRARGSAAARRVGLALAVVAAFKAIAQASTIGMIGMRVGSYLLVGAFLLGVAWWYRASDDERGDAPDERASAGPEADPRAGMPRP